MIFRNEWGNCGWLLWFFLWIIFELLHCYNMRCENFAQSTFYTFFHLRQCRVQAHFGGQRVCCGRHHHRKVYIRLVVVRPLPFEDFTSVVKEVAKQGNDFRTLNKVLAERWHGRGVEALLHPRGGQLARLGLDTGRRLQRRSERCGCGHQAGWAVVQGEGGTNWKEIGWPGSEGLSPQGGRGRTHGVSPKQQADDPNEVEASSWGASRLRPEENNQFKSGFEALAFRRQALSRGWAEVEGCRIHVSFAGEKTVTLEMFCGWVIQE